MQLRAKDHNNDSDDMPTNLDPLGFENFIQLENFKSYNRTIPHEDDTDDIDHRFNPVGWNNHAQKDN